jgi:hypothetical protein
MAVAAAAVAASLLGPVAYSLSTASTVEVGSIVTAGPSTGVGFGGMPGLPGTGGLGGAGQLGGLTGGPQVGGQQGGLGGMPAGPFGFGGGTPQGSSPVGGLLTGSTPSAEITALLTENADAYTWVAATIGANSAAGYQLAAEEPVMAIGGFNGTDPSPTLTEFMALVSQGKIHYFIAAASVGGATGMGLNGAESDSEISAWVAANFTQQDVDGVTVFDLTAGSGQPAGSQT